MLNAFTHFIAHEQLFQPTDQMLLAVSGGLDSVVLADLFRLAGFSYGIAHVNFQLRGAESEEEAMFVRALAGRHRVRFHMVRMPKGQQAEKSGISTQMAARQFRYAWFEQLADEAGYTRIVTAHHQDDVLETVLLNLVRGTGLTGLTGIPIRQGRVIRPLWFADRASLEQYARENALTWREDSSNQSDKYRRNQLRHQVVPVLKQLNPNLLQTLQTTLVRLKAADALLHQELRRTWEEVVEVHPDGFQLALQKLIMFPEWEYRLSEWLKPFGFQYVQISSVGEAVRSSQFGQVFYSTTHRIIRDRDSLLIEPLKWVEKKSIVLASIPDQTIWVSPSFGLTVELIDRTANFTLPTNPTIACLDADRIQWPLTVRPWQPGDRFRPLGLSGSQSVGDFFTNRKISLTERQSAWVLESGGQIAWLIGYRLDDRFRITDQTRNFLIIKKLARNTD
ncbi:tRNA lysidine(34) synthetase TilS [Larkinella sp. VNQ87]|uniref:tRNA lysidine(34) synthetase TilS n=1 Tax=Larkinella sp. VNQ87 TaxID=3400921 RepID=UPI003C00D887